MIPDNPTDSALWGDPLAELHARYDGPPPRAARRAARKGRTEIPTPAPQTSGVPLHSQCAAARLAVTRRRGQVPVAALADDAWLCRLSAALRDARMVMAA